MKKILVLLLTLALLLSVAACEKTETESTETETVPEVTEAAVETEMEDAIELAADGRYPAETIKIGFVNYDTTAEQVLAIQSYYEYLQTAFNFEVIWSESLGSAEEEFAFIEQCAAAGCQAIVGYYNEGKEESVKLAASLGMYYWGLNGLPDAYEAIKDEPYYIGSFTSATNQNYEFGYNVAQMLIDNDCHKIIVMSGGKDYGIDFFIDRYNGIMDRIAEAQDAGYDIEVVYEVPGWPGTEEFAAHQTAALETDADGLAGTLTSLMWIQPMQVAEKFGQIKVACVDTAAPVVVDMMGAGMYVGICAEIPDVFGLSIPMIINAVTGYGDQQRNADGSAALINSGYWVIDNIGDAAFYSGIETDGTWAWDVDDVKTIIGAYNPDFTVEDMSALYTAVTSAEIQARRAD